MTTHTLYIAPGYSQCRVFMIPHPMRPGQNPRDLLPEYQRLWKEIGLLNHRLEVVCLDPEYQAYRDDIAGTFPGTWFYIEDNQ